MASETPLTVIAFESYSFLKTTTGQGRTERHREICIVSSIFILFLSIYERFLDIVPPVITENKAENKAIFLPLELDRTCSEQIYQ